MARFHPGQSGNPAGKRRGTRNRATRLLDAMAKTDATDVLRAILDRAKAGDARSAELILARLARSSRSPGRI